MNKKRKCSRKAVYLPIANFVLEAFAAFLELYKEGALIVLTLLQAIIRPEQWKTRTSEKWWWIPDDKRYLGYNILFLPDITGREPLEILLLLAS